MPLIEKNDVNQIFADQAPSIDKPPMFANYPYGWGMSRPNNGKPTIKQFNYLQQRTDQNILWIHQNGAALPYDASIEYAENAIVLKDGELQQFKGGVWSTLVAKKVDAVNVIGKDGKNQEQVNKINSDKIVSVLDFPEQPDDTNAFLKAKEKSNTVYFSFKDYTIPLFRTPATPSVIDGQGATINVDSNNGSSVVAVQLIGSPTIKDLTFKNKGVSLDGSRTVVSNNTALKNVGFYNFVHSVSQPNAWGLYLKANKNVYIENCHFGNNSQSDIAILEGSENVTIVNARNDVDDGVYLNLEPNNDVQVKNVTVIGGKYRHISLLENSNLNYVIKGFNCIGASIKSLRYRGAEASFHNCEIDFIEGNWAAFDATGAQVEYAGALRINNANLSKNFISNYDLSDLTTSAASFWNINSNAGSPSVNFVRYNDVDGCYSRINNSKANIVSVFTRNKLPISSISTMVFAMRYRCNNDSNVLNYEIAQIQWFDASGTMISKSSIKGGRGAVGSNSGWHTDVCVFKPPASATQYQLFLTTKVGASMDVSKVGVYDLSLNNGSNFNAIIDELSTPKRTISFSVQTNYTVASNAVTNVDVNGVVGAKVGMTVKNIRSSLVLGNNSLFYGEVVSDGLVRIYHRNLSATATITQNALLYFDVE